MAERPLFIPAPETPALVRVVNLSLQWHSGFAPVQKKKNVAGLHEAAARAGYAPVLEVSTKSDEKLGQRLSAFSLKVDSDIAGKIRLECAFQGSKVFEHGGPYTDLYASKDPRDAKRDARLQQGGRIIAFEFNGFRFPTDPRTVFYDWLYISAIAEHREWFKSQSSFLQYAGFTDIEFNPAKSINCQARSCALFASLIRSDLLMPAVESPGAFVELMTNRQGFEHRREPAENQESHPLFPR